MNLKNYTSSVPVEKTVSRIEAVLAKAGACSIQKQYGPGGELSALMFEIESPTRTFKIRLPADANRVFEAMKSTISKPQRGTLNRLKEQSSRTAWKLMQDWTEVQVSLISMQQADPVEVFLPYLWDGKETFFQHLKGNSFKALPERT